MTQTTESQNQPSRQEGVDDFSSPEKLDQAVEVVNPQAWIPLTAIGILIAVAGIWSVFGRLPLRVSGQGVLMRPQEHLPLQVRSSGKIDSLSVEPGDKVTSNQVLGQLDQSELEQQLQEAQAKLKRLQEQSQESEGLSEEQVAIQRSAIQKQREALQNNLNVLEDLTPILREQNVSSIEQKRKGLEKQLEQLNSLTPTLKERVETVRELANQGVIPRDRFLQTQQEYFNHLAKISDLESQKAQLELKKTDAERQYLQNRNKKQELQAKLRDLANQEKQLTQEQQKQDFDWENRIQEVKQKISQLKVRLDQEGEITSAHSGTLLDWSVVPGQVVQAGERIGSLEREKENAKLMTLAYFPTEKGKKISAGMPAQVTPTTVKRERYGGIIGEVVSVSPFPVTTQEINSNLGNPELAKNLGGERAPLQITIKLQTNEQNLSGYEWSSSEGPSTAITSGTTTNVQIRTGEIAPISYVIPLFKKWTGIY